MMVKFLFLVLSFFIVFNVHAEAGNAHAGYTKIDEVDGKMVSYFNFRAESITENQAITSFYPLSIQSFSNVSQRKKSLAVIAENLSQTASNDYLLQFSNDEIDGDILFYLTYGLGILSTREELVQGVTLTSNDAFRVKAKLNETYQQVSEKLTARNFLSSLTRSKSGNLAVYFDWEGDCSQMEATTTATIPVNDVDVKMTVWCDAKSNALTATPNSREGLQSVFDIFSMNEWATIQLPQTQHEVRFWVAGFQQSWASANQKDL
ncbi:hypothetical protein CAG70_04725 [Photobacterium halotolerans]|uniref:Uncharacterized protein n=2 Tax=Photobacterium halotolerans TaxID=265726 RepID=A0A7X4XWQ5_9GAMM|nr:hypothetical protein [Photobacterium halotolerans]NAW66674.1 hypothetical protein [Photobacterium halotolerans]NAX46298.1 hypothetical protein [Photobacterium halotolerans]